MTHRQPLFVVPQPLQKEAGRRISQNPNQWSSEILKAAYQEHPYIDLEGANVSVTSYTPEDMRAHGYIGLTEQSGILFTIRPNPERQMPELDSLDVLFDGGRFRHCNEYTYKQALQQQGGAYGKLPGYQRGNAPYSPEAKNTHYVGDLTGDNSPLEPNPAPSMAGSGQMGTTRTASCLRMGAAMTNYQMLGRLQNTLSNFRSISLSADMFGLKDSLVATAVSAVGGAMEKADGLLEKPTSMVISRLERNLGNFKLTFSNGDVRACGQDELKQMLGDQYNDTIRRIMRNGYATVRDWAALTSVDYENVRAAEPVIFDPGLYRISVLLPGSLSELSYKERKQELLNDLRDFASRKKDRRTAITSNGNPMRELGRLRERFEQVDSDIGRENPMQVVFNCMDLDGSTVDDGWKAFGFCRFTGHWITTSDVFRGCSAREDTSDMLMSASRANDQYGGMAPSNRFIFWFKSFSAVSPQFDLVRVLDVPGEDRLYILRRVLGAKTELAVRFVRSIQRPIQMPATEASSYGLSMPMYLVPSSADLIQLNTEPAEVIDRMAPSLVPIQKMASEGLGMVDVIRHGDDDWQVGDQWRLTDLEMIAKVAEGGMSDDRIDILLATKTDDVQRFALRTAKTAAPRAKTPYSKDSVLAFQKAAEEVMTGMDEGISPAPESLPLQTLDGLLTMQLGGDDNIDTILESEDMIAEVEDRIARMVMASRLGRDQLNEKGLTRALKGMDPVARSIQTLKMERESAEAL